MLFLFESRVAESFKIRSARLKRVRDKYEAELKEERAAVEKLLDQRKQQVEMEMELNRLRLVLRQKEHDIEDLVQVRLRLGSRLLQWDAAGKH